MHAVWVLSHKITGSLLTSRHVQRTAVLKIANPSVPLGKPSWTLSWCIPACVPLHRIASFTSPIVLIFNVAYIVRISCVRKRRHGAPARRGHHCTLSIPCAIIIGCSTCTIRISIVRIICRACAAVECASTVVMSVRRRSRKGHPCKHIRCALGWIS
jgi:hypothetical protein